MRKPISVGLYDRIASVISYLTAGWGGMLILVIMYFRKKAPSKFLQYNVFQAIFISLLFFVVASCLDLIIKILSYIPFINYLVAQISFLLNKPFLGDYSFLQTIIFGLLIYMIVFALQGKYPRIIGISKIIDYAVR